jgi:thiosulfate/3-mercaptopyruvate sulfurtransferase
VSNFVSAHWLHQRLRHVIVVDASWHLPTAKRDARAEFATQHIPGARFYDLDAGADPTSTLPHMLPSAEKFAEDMASLGIGNGSTVVCYDSVGLFSAARLWWMLKTFGHEQVFVLDGGLKAWLAAGFPTEGGLTISAVAGHVTGSFDQQQVQSLHGVAAALNSRSAQVLDARSPARFRGEEPEPRPGVKPGHMPSALNVHYATLLNADGTMKSGADLRAVFESAGVDLSKPIITSCGSGVTAAILILALTELGHADHALYDGSWAEWGASGREIVTG